MIRQTKTVQTIVLTLNFNNLLPDLLIHETFFSQMLEKSRGRILQASLRHTFPLYGSTRNSASYRRKYNYVATP